MSRGPGGQRSRSRGIPGPGQEAGQAGREPGSGDRAGVSSGAGGLRFLPSAWRVWGYQAARLPSWGHWAGGEEVGTGQTLAPCAGSSGPEGSWQSQADPTGSLDGQGLLKRPATWPRVGTLWGKSSRSWAGNSDGHRGLGCPPTPHPLPLYPPLILPNRPPNFGAVLHPEGAHGAPVQSSHGKTRPWRAGQAPRFRFNSSALSTPAGLGRREGMRQGGGGRGLGERAGCGEKGEAGVLPRGSGDTGVAEEAGAWRGPGKGSRGPAGERGRGLEKAPRGQKRRPSKEAKSGQWLTGWGPPKINGGRLGGREVPHSRLRHLLSPSRFPGAAREAVGPGWCHGEKTWAPPRSPSWRRSWETQHRELGILREERLNPHSTGKRPAPLASFPLRGLRSPFPA